MITEYRLFSNLTQKDVDVKSGVSIFTISADWNGCRLMPNKNYNRSMLLSLNESIKV